MVWTGSEGRVLEKHGAVVYDFVPLWFIFVAGSKVHSDRPQIWPLIDSVKSLEEPSQISSQEKLCLPVCAAHQNPDKVGASTNNLPCLSLPKLTTLAKFDCQSFKYGVAGLYTILVILYGGCTGSVHIMATGWRNFGGGLVIIWASSRISGIV